MLIKTTGPKSFFTKVAEKFLRIKCFLNLHHESLKHFGNDLNLYLKKKKLS